MGFSSVGGARGHRATVARVARWLVQGKRRESALELGNIIFGEGTKKPRTMPGLLYC